MELTFEHRTLLCLQIAFFVWTFFFASLSCTSFFFSSDDCFAYGTTCLQYIACMLWGRVMLFVSMFPWAVHVCHTWTFLSLYVHCFLYGRVFLFLDKFFKHWHLCMSGLTLLCMGVISMLGPPLLCTDLAFCSLSSCLCTGLSVYACRFFMHSLSFVYGPHLFVWGSFSSVDILFAYGPPFRGWIQLYCMELFFVYWVPFHAWTSALCMHLLFWIEPICVRTSVSCMELFVYGVCFLRMGCSFVYWICFCVGRRFPAYRHGFGLRICSLFVYIVSRYVSRTNLVTTLRIQFNQQYIDFPVEQSIFPVDTLRPTMRSSVLRKFQFVNLSSWQLHKFSRQTI